MRYIPRRAGEPFGQAPKLAYVTPDHPDGIAIDDLQAAAAAVQFKVMVAWFLANFDQAKGPFFGFTEQTPSARDDGPSQYAGTSSTRVVGWGEGPWLDGGRAPDLLKTEFGGFMEPSVIEAVAQAFSDLWTWKPPLPSAIQSEAELRGHLALAVDAFGTDVETVLAKDEEPRHGGAGHNNPPGPILDQEEKAILLRATADMKLAVSSGADQSVLSSVWSAAAPVAAKLGKWALDRANDYFTNLSVESGKSSGKLLPYIIVAALGIWLKFGFIADILKLLPKP